MTDYPKVSVVTITYGHENYITQTLDGVLMQDYPGEIEFIIANDNSPDQTDIVIKNYLSSAKIPENYEIKYTKHDANKGMMPNFIWALEHATGKYIALCEGDDYWTDPRKLQKQVEFLEANEEYIIHSARARVIQRGKSSTIIGKIGEKRSFNIRDFHMDNPLITCTVMFKNQHLSNLKMDNVLFVDWMFYATLLSRTAGTSAYTSPEVVASYRIHGGGVMQTLSTQYKSNIACLHHIFLIKKYLHCSYTSQQIADLNTRFVNAFSDSIVQKKCRIAYRVFIQNLKVSQRRAPVRLYLKVLIYNLVRKYN